MSAVPPVEPDAAAWAELWRAMVEWAGRRQPVPAEEQDKAA